MPTNTDLVKDLPADFDIFGQAVDDRIKALNPETTTGDISYRSATANTNTRLAIGTAGQVLTVNSGATAPQWSSPGASGFNLIDEVPFTSSASVIVNNVFTSTYKNYKIMVVGKGVASNDAVNLTLKLRASGTNTSTGYAANRIYVDVGTVGAAGGGTTDFYLGVLAANDNGNSLLTFDLGYPQLSSYTSFLCFSVGDNNADNTKTQLVFSGGYLRNTTSYDGFELILDQNSTGAVFIYGYAKE